MYFPGTQEQAGLTSDSIIALTGNPALGALAETRTYPETGWEALNTHGPGVLPSRWETISPNSIRRASGQPHGEAAQVVFEAVLPYEPAYAPI